jgi:hypothetical protein
LLIYSFRNLSTSSPKVIIFGTVCATVGPATPYQDHDLSHVVLHREYFDGHGFQILFLTKRCRDYDKEKSEPSI